MTKKQYIVAIEELGRMLNRENQLKVVEDFNEERIGWRKSYLEPTDKNTYARLYGAYMKFIQENGKDENPYEEFRITYTHNAKYKKVEEVKVEEPAEELQVEEVSEEVEIQETHLFEEGVSYEFTYKTMSKFGEVAGSCLILEVERFDNVTFSQPTWWGDETATVGKCKFKPELLKGGCSARSGEIIAIRNRTTGTYKERLTISGRSYNNVQAERITNSYKIECEIKKHGYKVGSINPLINKLSKEDLNNVLGRIEYSSTDVDVYIDKKLHIVEIVECDWEIDICILTQDEYISRYGNERWYEED